MQKSKSLLVVILVVCAFLAGVVFSGPVSYILGMKDSSDVTANVSEEADQGAAGVVDQEGKAVETEQKKVEEVQSPANNDVSAAPAKPQAE